MFNSKVFLAEFIGTFALTFIGVAAGISGEGGVAVALAHGFTLAVMVYAFGYVSGAHVNPAVTFAFAINGTLKLGQAVFYWLAQFAGAIVAALLLKGIVGDISGGATIGTLTIAANQSAEFYPPLIAMGVEAILTFFLVNTILNTAYSGRGGMFSGWAIGTTLAFAILAGGPLTGASLNPARTFGPAIFTEPSFAHINTYVIYFFGPLIGALLAAMLYNFMNDISDEPLSDIDESETEIVAKPKRTAKKAAKK